MSSRKKWLPTATRLVEPADSITVPVREHRLHRRRSSPDGNWSRMIAAYRCFPTKGAGRYEIAVAISGPDRILIGARDFPGHLIAARRLLGADRRPATKLTRHNIGATVFQRGTEPSADVIEKKIAADRDQTGRAGRLDHCPGNGNTDCTVAVQVLMETGLE